MVRDGDHFYQFRFGGVDHTEWKLVQNKPAVASMKQWPTERRLLNLKHRNIEFC
jgi:hypothetical protein